MSAKLPVEYLQKHFGKAPQLLIVLGSGLADFTQELENAEKIRVSDLPGGKASSVEGHRGEILVGQWRNYRIGCLSGRLHGYEGHSAQDVVFSLRSLRAWGVQKFILTNASGSLHKDISPGELCLISDHINFTGQNPLVGTELYGGFRFPDCSDIYSKSWRESLKKQAEKNSVSLKEGVYVGVFGPSYETPAEIRMFHRWGGDIVGMSTVWEALALKQMGAELIGVSLVSNYGAGLVEQALKHEDVLAIGKKSFKDFVKIIFFAIEQGFAE